MDSCCPRGGVSATGEEWDEFDRATYRGPLIFREAGLFALSLLAAYFLVNHRAFFVFPPDFTKALGATWPTYLFLALIVDVGLHVAFLLLQPGPAIGVRREASLRVPPGALATGFVRQESARRPPRAVLAESRHRGVETALELRRAIAAAERQWDDVAVHEAIDDLSTFLAEENPEASLPEPEPSDPVYPPQRPLRVVRRVVRPDIGPSLESASPWEARIGARSRPGERTPPES